MTLGFKVDTPIHSTLEVGFWFLPTPTVVIVALLQTWQKLHHVILALSCNGMNASELCYSFPWRSAKCYTFVVQREAAFVRRLRFQRFLCSNRHVANCWFSKHDHVSLIVGITWPTWLRDELVRWVPTGVEDTVRGHRRISRREEVSYRCTTLSPARDMGRVDERNHHSKGSIELPCETLRFHVVECHGRKKQ